MPAVECQGSLGHARISSAMAMESEQGFVQRRSGDCLCTGGDCEPPRLRKAAVHRRCSRVPGEQQDIPTLGLGGFGESWLWLSTQGRYDDAWIQRFSDGSQDTGGIKDYKCAVRACRAF